MILIGLTMAIRSQGDVALSSTQKSTSRALSAAEVGVTKYQYLLNTVRLLALYPNTATSPNPSWSNPTAISGYSSCSGGGNIPTSSITGTYATTDWQNIDSKTQFKLVSYSYAADAGAGSNPPPGTLLGTGTLTVQGRVNISGNGNSATNTNSTSTAQLQVKIPVKQTNPSTIPVPGVWVSGTSDTDATGNNRIEGNVLLNNCNVSLSNINVVNPNGTNYSTRYTSASLPDVPAQPTSGVIPLSISDSVTLPRPARTETTGNGNNAVTTNLPADTAISSYRG